MGGQVFGQCWIVKFFIIVFDDEIVFVVQEYFVVVIDLCYLQVIGLFDNYYFRQMFEYGVKYFVRVFK